jgi:hypothetical protein
LHLATSFYLIARDRQIYFTTFLPFLRSRCLPQAYPPAAPATPPIIAPFFLFLLTTAPVTAPAPAPIAAFFPALLFVVVVWASEFKIVLLLLLRFSYLSI